MFERVKSIKLSDYFELVKPSYIYLKIIPHKSIRNYNSSNIVKAIAHTYRAINKRIYKAQKKIFFETDFKISYVIDIEGNNTNFYFIVPRCFESIITEKVREIWSKATIESLESIKGFGPDSEYYELMYKKEDALSVQVDRKSNEPLNSILSVMDIMKSDDRVTLIYNFIPRSQFGWLEQYQNTMEKIQKKKTIIKNTMSFEYLLKNSLEFVIGALDMVLEVVNDFTGGKPIDAEQSLYASIMSVLEQQGELSTSTKKKKEATVVNCQIGVVSTSSDDTRRGNNALTVCQSFRSLDEDNELIYRQCKNFNLNDNNFNITTNIISADEGSNFIQIPGRTLLNYFKIKHIETEETEVPEELQNGIMCIGSNTFKGKVTKAYLSNDIHYRNLTTCIIGPTRAGKTTLLTNIIKDAIMNNETTIIFDFCGNCELSKDISSAFNKNKVLDIDCTDFDNMQGLGYNEVYPKSDNPFEVYRCAKTKTQQLVSLVNSINDTSLLEPRMERYLKAAALVVFIDKGSFKDAFQVLYDYRARKKYIDLVPVNQKDNLEEHILTLEELDEWSKSTKDNPAEVIGTKIASVQGILNRVDKMKSNTYMELMLKKDCSNNINLVEEMQKAQLICLKMPETMFTTDTEKDIYCTYWLTKIWGALQIRYDELKEEDRVKVNIVFDELYQVPKCQDFLRTKINQIAKKTCKPIISCHSLEQIKYIRPELKSANTSYMLIAGCNKDNYSELKEELEPYEVEDLLSLKRYHSLNLIKCSDGYAKFITKLPSK